MDIVHDMFNPLASTSKGFNGLIVAFDKVGRLRRSWALF